jgi:hypothetical protein
MKNITILFFIILNVFSAIVYAASSIESYVMTTNSNGIPVNSCAELYRVQIQIIEIAKVNVGVRNT